MALLNRTPLAELAEIWIDSYQGTDDEECSYEVDEEERQGM